MTTRMRRMSMPTFRRCYGEWKPSLLSLRRWVYRSPHIADSTPTSDPGGHPLLGPHQLRENRLVVGTFGAGQVEAQCTGEAERHQLLLLAAGVVARVAVRADELLVADVPFCAVKREPVAHVQRIACPRLVLRRRRRQ